MTLQSFFAEHPHVAVAFSGGVDSAYLLYAAVHFGAQATAYYVKTPFQPDFEYRDACRLAQQLGVLLVTIPLDILADPEIAANPADRCYFCKRRVFAAIRDAAQARGQRTLLDGTNASDSAADRPGMRALQQLQVLSPLRLCGLTKDDIRRLSQQAGLFTWNKPAYACLATRIPAGTPITSADLQRTEQCEAFLMQLGFSDFRIRLYGSCAVLQLCAAQLPLLSEHRQKIVSELKQHYSAVLLDLEARGEKADA